MPRRIVQESSRYSIPSRHLRSIGKPSPCWAVAFEGMELCRLTEHDEGQALLAHEELAAEQFDFLLSYDTGTDWMQYLKKIEDTRQGRNLPDGHVPATFLVAKVEGDLVGRVSIRHNLNPYLRVVGGHIGYAVRPQFRRRGYAEQILKLSLTEAQKLGINRVLVTCDAHNQASKRTIERCGGELEPPLAADGAAATRKLRFWIDS